MQAGKMKIWYAALWLTLSGGGLFWLSQRAPVVSGQAANSVVAVSAASYGAELAPESIAAAFGARLATSTAIAAANPLPTNLAGTTVRVNGQLAPLFFVSAGQVNFLIPAGTPVGTAILTVTAGDGTTSLGTLRIAAAAPGLFTSNANGSGALSAILLRRGADGRDSFESLSQYSQTEQAFVTRSITYGAEGEQLFLLFFGTGLRGAAPSSVRVNLGSVAYAPLYVGPQGELAGLDQVNFALPRSFPGRGRITLFLTTAGANASNQGEIEIGGVLTNESNAPLQLTNVSAALLEVGQEIEISGAGFAANPRENMVQIVGDDGVTAKAEVLSVNANSLRIQVPPGAGTGYLKVTRGGLEASLSVRVKTSLSGFIERLTDGGARVAIPGARIQLVSKVQTAEATANADGAFVLSGLTAQERAGFRILPPPNSGLEFPEKPFTLRIKGDRDNQLPRGDEQFLVKGIPFPLQDASDATALAAAAPTLTLSYLPPGRTPANLSAGHFSTRIAQLTPFGEPIAGGARLRFPNADGIPTGATATLFKFDQTPDSATLGQFIPLGSAAVTADGQFVETVANAVTEGSYYFVSTARPLAAINGRVIESDGRPVPRAIVQARGQSTFTDGLGGFVLANVPVLQASGDRVKVEVSYQRPNGSIARKDGAEVTLVAGALATISPDIALEAVTNNLPPVLLAPVALTLEAGEAREFDFIAYDPDGAQPLQVTQSDTAAAFTMLTALTGNAYRLRIAPNAEGAYQLMLTARDGAGLTNGVSLALTVTARSTTAPVAYAQAVTLNEDTPRALTLAGRDPGGAGLTFTLMTQPARGMLSGAPPNLTYTPRANFNGLDSFTFKVSSASGESQSATVSLLVNPVNDAPVLNLPGALSANAGEPLNVVITATDVDGEANLRLTVTGLPPAATLLETGGNTWQLLWTPTFAQEGSYAIGLTVTDSNRLSASQNLQLRVRAPWAKTSGIEGGEIEDIAIKGNSLIAGTLTGGVYLTDLSGGNQGWTAINEGLTGRGRFIEAVAVIGNDIYLGTFGAGVYRSSNDGRTWTAVNQGLGDPNVYSLAVLGGKLYAGTYFGRVYVLSGNTWERISSGLPELGVHALAVIGNDLYAGLNTNAGGVYVLRSGQTQWQPLLTGLVNRDILRLAVSGTNLIAGTYFGGLYRLKSGSQSWERINNGLPSPNLEFVALAAQGNLILAGAGDRFYFSTNSGDLWTARSSGIPPGHQLCYAITASGWLTGMNGGGVLRLRNNETTWERYSAGLTAGFVQDFLTDGNQLYAAFRGLGVYTSTNNGQSWREANAGGVNPFAQALAKKGNKVFVGTYNGIFATANNGQSWQKVGLNIVNDYTDALAASETHLFAGTTYDGVFTSANDGQSWNTVNNGLPKRPSPNNSFYLRITALHARGTRLFVGTDGEDNTTADGIYYSDNNGQSWSPTNVTDTAVSEMTSIGTRLFAGTFGRGVLTSTDNGLTWNQTNSGLPGLAIGALTTDGTRLIASVLDRGVYVSTNQGQSWTPLNDSLTGTNLFSLSASETALLAGTRNESIFRLANNTQTWTTAPMGLTNTFVNAVATSGERLLAATLGSGVFRSENRGQSWSSTIGLPAFTNVQALAQLGNNRVMVGAYGEGVFRSVNDGRNWSAANNGLTNKFINALTWDGGSLFAATDGGGVFRSDDQGDNWRPVMSHPALRFTLALAVQGTTLCAGTDGGGVLASTDKGETWTVRNSGLSSLNVRALHFVGTALYAGTLNGGIFRLAGEQWRSLNATLPAGLPVFSFAAAGEKLYAGTIYGVFLSTDQGETWKQVNAGLLDIFVTSLAVSGDRLIAGTRINGVFTSQIP